MKRTQTELAYVKAAVESSSPVTLVLLLFDSLIGDLQNAIAAIHSRDIEKRCEDIKHAFRVLQQLQEFVDTENGGEAATNFTNFYSAIRSKVLEGHVKISAETLQRQIELLLDVRQAWQQVSIPNVSSALPTASLATPTTTQEEAPSASWTA